MTISEQIKVLFVRSDISVAEFASRIGTSPQNFNVNKKRESFTIKYLEKITSVVLYTFEHHFILDSSEKILNLL